MKHRQEGGEDSDLESSSSSSSSKETREHEKALVKMLGLIAKSDSFANLLKSSKKKKKKKKKSREEYYSPPKVILKKKRSECSDSFSSDTTDKRFRLSSSEWGNGKVSAGGWGSSNIGQLDVAKKSGGGDCVSSNIGQREGRKKSEGGGWCDKGKSEVFGRVSGWSSNGLPNIGQSSVGRKGNDFGVGFDLGRNFSPGNVDNRSGFRSNVGHGGNQYEGHFSGRGPPQRPPYGKYPRPMIPDRGSRYRKLDRYSQSRNDRHNQYRGQHRSSDTYWVCFKPRSFVRSQIKLVIGTRSIRTEDASKYSSYLTVEGDLVYNPIYRENILDPIVDYIWKYEQNPQLKLPNNVEVMDFLRKLYDHIMFYIKFKVLVKRIREICYRLKYRICEKRDVPFGTTIDKRGWYKQVVFGYAYNQYHHVHMKKILEETEGISYEGVICCTRFLSIPRRDTLDFARPNPPEKDTCEISNKPAMSSPPVYKRKVVNPHPEENDDANMKSDTAPENIPGGQKKNKEEDDTNMSVDEIIADANKNLNNANENVLDGKEETSAKDDANMSVDEETKCSSTVLSVYEEETKRIEKNISLLVKGLDNESIKFNIFIPRMDVQTYMKNVYHDKEEFNWETFSDIFPAQELIDENYFADQVVTLRFALKEILREVKNDLLTQVSHEEIKSKQLNVDGDNKKTDECKTNLHLVQDNFNECKSFLEFLPSCIEFDYTFQVDAFYRDEFKLSYCPLSVGMKNWREYSLCSSFLKNKKYNSCPCHKASVKGIVAHCFEMRDKCKYHRWCFHYLKMKHQICDVKAFIQVSSGCCNKLNR